MGISAPTIRARWRELNGGASRANRSIRCSSVSIARLKEVFM